MRKGSGTLLLAVLLCGLLWGCAKAAPAASPAATAPEMPAAEVGKPLPNAETLTYGGETYRRREDLTTFLVMGLDTYAHQKETGYINTMQSDFLALLILDEDRQDCQILHINRDTITKIRRLGIGGAAGSFQGQIALAHTYGSGGSDSCLNAVRAVSDLLYGVKIDHYMTLTMDAIGTINDALGGVPVEIAEDMTAVDPAFRKGETVLLRGDQALGYIRSRKDLEDSSNVSRMERQRQYMTAFYETLTQQSREDETLLARLLMEVSGGFVSDCTANRLNSLMTTLGDCRMGQIRTIKGDAVRGEEFMEFHPDRKALLEQVLELFYEKL